MKCAFFAAGMAVLVLTSVGCTEEAAGGNAPAGVNAPARGADEAMVMAPVAGPTPDFKPYIFWAYGLACLLIFLFILWTLSQLRRVEEKVEHLARTQAERRTGPG
jgi:hypothetical protein